MRNWTIAPIEEFGLAVSKLFTCYNSIRIALLQKIL